MRMLVIVIALLVERFFNVSHFRTWHWFTSYQRLLLNRLSSHRTYLFLILSVVPILLAVFAMTWLLQPLLLGLLALLFVVLLSLYCLGPLQLWAHVDNDHGAFFIAANRRVFASVFWFMLLGLGGIVGYRLITLLAGEQGEQTIDVEGSQIAQKIESYLNWPVIRLLTFVFALGGNFNRVFTCWRKQALSGVTENNALLASCGQAALSHAETTVSETVTQKAMMALVDRSLIIFLVIMIIVSP